MGYPRLPRGPGDGNDVVAYDGARAWEALFKADFHLRADAADPASDRRACDGRENRDGGVTSEDAHRAADGWVAEVGPGDVAAGYHSGR